MLLPVGPLSPAAADTSSSPVAFAGEAFGTRIKVGDTVKSGPTAYVTLGCTTIAGLEHQNNTATTNFFPLVTTGTTVNTVGSSADGTTYTSSASADVQNASLLAGLITADALHSISNTSWNGAAFSSSGGATFVNLKVDGQAIAGSPPPNTKVDLDGLGYVIFNEQKTLAPKSKPTRSFIVSAIHVVINEQNPDFKVGTDIVIAKARSTLNAPVAGVMSGLAFGTTATLFGVVQHGRSAAQPLPCLGTDGAVLENATAGVSFPGLTSGTVVSTAEGTVTPTQISARMTNTIQSVDLLDDVVTASVVHANAEGSRAVLGPANLTDEGSHFVDLHVSGFPAINDSVPPNTRVELPGVGILWLHRVLRPDDHTIQVRMIELKITADDTGLPKGTVIIVSSARLSLGE